jgi:hypothetical protein
VAPEESLQTQATALTSMATSWRALEQSWHTSVFDSLVVQLGLGADSSECTIQGVRGNRVIIRGPSNARAARRIHTASLWQGGSSGLNLTGANDWGDLAIWDFGHPLEDHREYVGRVRFPLCVDERVEPEEESFICGQHPTHCAGTMIASGADTAAHGMSPEAYLDCYQIEYDTAEMADAAANGLLVSNHSYGQYAGWSGPYLAINDTTVWVWSGDVTVSRTEDYGFGFYDIDAAQRDTISYMAPYYTMVQAAGNDRGEAGNVPMWPYVPLWYDAAVDSVWATRIPNCPGAGCPRADAADGGYDTLPSPATAKNVITVGSVYPWPEEPFPSAFSSFGPTDDGRIKPDIMAVGDELYSSCPFVEWRDPEDLYAVMSGTSMACASVSGSINLLVQYYEAKHFGAHPRSATVKAVLVQTAHPLLGGYAPDYRCGWGVMDTRSAAALIDEDAWRPTRIQEETLPSGGQHDFFVYSDGNTPLVATIAWTDPPGAVPTPTVDPTSPMLVNDLDLRVTYVEDQAAYYPYVLNPASPASAATTGDNSLDNVEKIAIAEPAAGYYLVSVAHKGTLAEPQPYSLVMTGGGSPSVTTYQNKSSATGISFAGTPYSEVALDYNNDGKQDLFVSLKDTQYGRLFRQDNLNGEQVPVFTERTGQDFVAGQEPPSGLRGIAAADIDNDGNIDFISARGASCRLYRNSGAPDYRFSNITQSAGLTAFSYGSWAASWGDYDGDGRVDLALGLSTTSGASDPYTDMPADPVVLLRNTSWGGTISFTDVSETALVGGPAEIACVSAAWGDLDNDGDLDLVFGDASGAEPGMVVYVNNGNGTLSPLDLDNTVLQHPLEIDNVDAVTLGDYDNNGALDLALAQIPDQGAWGASIQFNAGDGSYVAKEPAIVNLSRSTDIRGSDVDRDGWLDAVVLPEAMNSTVRLMLNRSLTSPDTPVFFDVAPEAQLTDGNRADGAVVCDFNSDGDDDLLLGRQTSNGHFFYKAVHTGGQEAPVNDWAGMNLAPSGANNEACLGAQVTLHVGAYLQTQVVDGGSGRGGQGDRRLSWGLGDRTGLITATTVWPNGESQLDTLTRNGFKTVIDKTSPKVAANTVDSHYVAKAGGKADWVFEWDTDHACRTALDQVTITDATNPPECETLGTVVLTPSYPYVVASVMPKAGGKYTHTMTWANMDCIPPCNYYYTVSSATDATRSTSAQHQIKIKVCIE